MTQNSARIHSIFERLNGALSELEQVRGGDEVREENQRLLEENESLVQENARLSNELQQLQQEYLALQTAANNVAGQIDGSLEQLDMLMEASA